MFAWLVKRSATGAQGAGRTIPLADSNDTEKVKAWFRTELAAAAKEHSSELWLFWSSCQTDTSFTYNDICLEFDRVIWELPALLVMSSLGSNFTRNPASNSLTLCPVKKKPCLTGCHVRLPAAG